jgi:hypothetical protein
VNNMNRWAGFVALTLVSGSAAAEWVSLGDQGSAELFVDRGTIVRSGDRATMWSVNALKTPGSANGIAYVSLKRQDEFDCAGSRMRGMQISAHAQPMGEGPAVIAEKGSGAWTPVIPEAISEVLWKIACNKE